MKDERKYWCYFPTNRNVKNLIKNTFLAIKILRKEKPDLIVLDGGKNQIMVCKEIINSLNLNIPIVGLVKDDHHKTNHLLNASLEEIPIPEDSNLFLYLSRIQEEVHRYAITYHRNIKAKGALSSTLDMVPGIGEKRRKELLKQFGSLKKMKEAKIEELEKIVGKDVAKNLYDYLHEE